MLEWSDLLDIGAQNDVDGEGVGSAGLDVAARQLALPDGLDPLPDALQRADVFQ